MSQGGDAGFAKQLGLFDAKSRERQHRLNRSLDAIAEKFGSSAVLPADVLGKKKG